MNNDGTDVMRIVCATSLGFFGHTGRWRLFLIIFLCSILVSLVWPNYSVDKYLVLPVGNLTRRVPLGC